MNSNGPECPEHGPIWDKHDECRYCFNCRYCVTILEAYNLGWTDSQRATVKKLEQLHRPNTKNSSPRFYASHCICGHFWPCKTIKSNQMIQPPVNSESRNNKLK